MQITRPFNFLWTVRNKNTGEILHRDTSRDSARKYKRELQNRGIPVRLFRQAISLGSPEPYDRG